MELAALEEHFCPEQVKGVLTLFCYLYLKQVVGHEAHLYMMDGFQNTPKQLSLEDSKDTKNSLINEQWVFLHRGEYWVARCNIR